MLFKFYAFRRWIVVRVGLRSSISVPVEFRGCRPAPAWEA